MIYLVSVLLRLTRDHSGGVSAEYSFLIVFIAIVTSVGMLALGPGIAEYFEGLTRLVPDTQANPPCPMGGCP